MQKMNVYSILDKAADECGPLFEAKNDAVASRAFAQEMRNIDINALKDFSLIRLGVMDHDLIQFDLEPVYVEVAISDELLVPHEIKLLDEADEPALDRRRKNPETQR